MSIEWYRICFDPKNGTENFESATAFQAWLDENLAPLNPEAAGRIILRWDHCRTNKGTPLWNAIVRASSPADDVANEVLLYLGGLRWEIGGYDVILYIKDHAGANERLFPVHTRFGDDS